MYTRDDTYIYVSLYTFYVITEITKDEINKEDS